jgi:hypothetical protein
MPAKLKQSVSAEMLCNSKREFPINGRMDVTKRSF